MVVVLFHCSFRRSCSDSHSPVVASLQKWSKGKVKDKANHAVLIEKVIWDKISKEIPTAKLITPSVLVERFKINGSLARLALKVRPTLLTIARCACLAHTTFDLQELHATGKIKQVVAHSAQMVYTRSVAEEEK